MKLKVNNFNPRKIEDQLGNEIFEFTGLHPSDIELIIDRFNNYEVDMKDAHNEGYMEGYSDAELDAELRES